MPILSAACLTWLVEVAMLHVKISYIVCTRFYWKSAFSVMCAGQVRNRIVQRSYMYLEVEQINPLTAVGRLIVPVHLADVAW